MKIRVEKSKDGHVVPVVTDDQGQVRHVGSMYDGRYAAKKWCDSRLEHGTIDLVLMGMGDMQIVLEASERLRGDVFVFEPCKEIFDLMKTAPIYKKAIKNTHVHVTTDIKEFSTWTTALLKDDILDETVFYVHPGCYRELWEEDVETIHKMMMKGITQLKEFKEVLSVVIDKLIMNELHNIVALKSGILLSRLFGKWSQDVPVIIVGAGPSLKKNINELKRVGDRACILAMDTAYPILVEAGIKPHILASVDAGKPIEIFGDLSKLDIPLLVTSNTRPELVSDTPGPKIWCYEAHSFARSIRVMIEKEHPTVPTDYGVSSLAISFPVEMGTRKIILVGMDMAFSAEGNSHAGVFSNEFIKDEEYVFDGYYGDKVYSRNDWADMKKWIEDITEEITYCTYINATEGGVRIHGTVQRPLREVVDGLKEVPFDWMRVLDEEEVRISDEEYDKMMVRYDKELESFDEFSKASCDDVFITPGFKRPSYFDLFLCSLWTSDKKTREERFPEGMSRLKGYFDTIREERRRI